MADRYKIYDKNAAEITLIAFRLSRGTNTLKLKNIKKTVLKIQKSHVIFAFVAIAIFVTLTICFTTTAYTQNLVPNHDFDEYYICPDGVSDFENFTKYWINFGGSPDYFHVCSSSSLSSIPHNVSGYQYPASGEAYAGLFTKQTPHADAKEYIGVQLFNILIPGKEYFVSFKVNQAYGGIGEINCATNNLGALFTTYQVDNPSMQYPNPLINNFAHINHEEIITDTANWVTVSGSFIADSAYKYIVIGNFFDDDLTADTIFFEHSGSFFKCQGYYFIDDVCVSDDPETCDIQTGIYDHHKENMIEIYPNPVKDKVHIYSNTNETVTISIYDMLGKLILKETIHSDVVFDLSEYSNGVYFVKARCGHVFQKRKIFLIK